MGWSAGVSGSLTASSPELLVMCEDCKIDGELLGKYAEDRKDMMVGMNVGTETLLLEN